MSDEPEARNLSLEEIIEAVRDGRQLMFIDELQRLVEHIDVQAERIAELEAENADQENRIWNALIGINRQLHPQADKSADAFTRSLIGLIGILEVAQPEEGGDDECDTHGKH